MLADVTGRITENFPHVTPWAIGLAVAMTLLNSFLAGEVGKRRKWSKRRVAVLALTLDAVWFSTLFALELLRWEDVSHAWEVYFIVKEVFDRSFSTLLRAATE